MSQEHMFTILGRIHEDPDFSSTFLKLPTWEERAKMLLAAGYDLQSTELTELQVVIQRIITREQQIQQLIQSAGSGLSETSAAVNRQIQNTLKFAGTTFYTVQVMSVTMFGFGILLFVVAAVWGAFAEQKIYALMFGGLGSAAFVAIFLTGSIDKVQRAISDLVKIDIAVIVFLDQVMHREMMVVQLRDSGKFDQVERMLDSLHDASVRIIETLERYVERNSKATLDQASVKGKERRAEESSVSMKEEKK